MSFSVVFMIASISNLYIILYNLDINIIHITSLYIIEN